MNQRNNGIPLKMFPRTNLICNYIIFCTFDLFIFIIIINLILIKLYLVGIIYF